MKALLTFLISCTLGMAAETKPRLLVIGDWAISIPADAEDRKTDGPDFSVTSIVFPALNAQLGIYQGGHPQEFAKNEKEVTKRKAKIGGQKVVWSVWKSQNDGKDFIRAETFMVCPVQQFEPGVTYEEKFHIFLSAPDEKSLSALQDVVRTLKKKEPNQVPVPMSPSGRRSTS